MWRHCRFIGIRCQRVWCIPRCYSVQTKSTAGGTLGMQPQLTQAEQSSQAIRLRELLEDAVRRSTADGILLSGGLDTSIVSVLAAQHGRKLQAVSVSVADVISPDEPFTK